MKLKARAVLLACAMSALVLAPVAEAKEFLSIATGGTSGTYYPIGGAIAKATSQSGALQVTAETGNASVANINLVAKGEIEIAFAQNDISYWAYNGQQMFKAPLNNLRAVAALYPEHVQLITAKDSNIKTMNDLKGKRVSVGAPGSGVEADVQAIFQVAKLSYKDMKIDYLDFGATTSRFKDNQIDAGFVVAGYPTASIMDLATTKPITLFNFDSAFLAELSKEHPYFVPSIIPAGTYNGIDIAINTPAVMAILITNDKVSDAAIYEFTKELYANIASVHASHAMAREIKLQTALEGLTIPLHPGAAKFFEEQGMKLPE